MTEFFIFVVAAITVGLTLRYVAHLKLGALRINSGARESFFSLADEALARGNLTSSELGSLDFMAQRVLSRSAQLMVIKEYGKEKTSEIDKVKNEAAVGFEHQDNEKSAWWGKLYFYWLLAVGSQGSLLALGAIGILLTHFDIERRIGLEAADRRAERTVYRLSHAGSH